MNDATAKGDGLDGGIAGSNSDEVGSGRYSADDPTRLHRRAVFLSELENARRMIAKAREVDRSLVVRELVGRRLILRDR